MHQFLREVCKLERSAEAQGDLRKEQNGRDRLIDSCVKVASMLMMQREEDSIRKGCKSFFHDLWFPSDKIPSQNGLAQAPNEVRVEEILDTLEACCHQKRGVNIGIDWFEPIAAEASLIIAAKYVEALCSRIATIHNIQTEVQPLSSSLATKPHAFNDFETRSLLLIPVLRALSIFCRGRPCLLSVQSPIFVVDACSGMLLLNFISTGGKNLIFI